MDPSSKDVIPFAPAPVNSPQGESQVHPGTAAGEGATEAVADENSGTHDIKRSVEHSERGCSVPDCAPGGREGDGEDPAVVDAADESLVDGNQAKEKARRRRYKEDGPLSLAHLLDHTPMRDDCVHCQIAKTVRRGAYRSQDREAKRPENFGDSPQADHVIANSEASEGITGDLDALIIVDLWIPMQNEEL